MLYAPAAFTASVPCKAGSIICFSMQPWSGLYIWLNEHQTGQSRSRSTKQGLYQAGVVSAANVWVRSAEALLGSAGSWVPWGGGTEPVEACSFCKSAFWTEHNTKQYLTIPNIYPHAAVLSFTLDLVLSTSCPGTLPQQPHGHMALSVGFTGWNWDGGPRRKSTKLTLW